MEVTTTKILIIFGLLISTLSAALLPILCLKSSMRTKKRRRRQDSVIEEETIWQRICCCCYKTTYFNGHHESKAALENGSIRTTASQARLVKLRSKMILSILNCFAGGIFLGTSFIGLLPEIRESFERANVTIRWPVLTSSGHNTSSASTEENDPMPIAEIIVVLGLFFILSVEQSAHSWNHWRQKNKNEFHGTGIHMKETVLNGDLVETITHEHSHDSNDSQKPVPDHDHSAIRSLMLVATLSIHSLLEGVAIGLQDDVGSVVAIFVAVLFHKSLMAFSMGTNLVRTKQAVKKIVAAAFIFAFMSPVGIAIGLVIKSTGGDDTGTLLVNAVLQSIATGTFLYITFFEVLVKEFDSHGDRLAKCLSLFVGYGSVLGAFFAQHG